MRINQMNVFARSASLYPFIRARLPRKSGLYWQPHAGSQTRITLTGIVTEESTQLSRAQHILAAGLDKLAVCRIGVEHSPIQMRCSW
jgi:hypothetical protein